MRKVSINEKIIYLENKFGLKSKVVIFSPESTNYKYTFVKEQNGNIKFMHNGKELTKKEAENIKRKIIDDIGIF